MTRPLPAAITLPSGRRVALDARKEPRAPLAREAGEPLFAETVRLLDGGALALTEDGKNDAPLDPDALALGDFHLLRALLTKHGWVAEEEVEFECENCGAEMRVAPCAALEMAPWLDGEIGDAELDSVEELGKPHPIPRIPLGRVRVAKTVTFAPRTLADAKPLFEALAATELEINVDLVEALGIQALGNERSREAIAAALAASDDEAFGAVEAAFVAAHYPLRMSAMAFCPSCKARNDVEAPAEREFVAVEGAPRLRDQEPGADESLLPPLVFPSFDAFAERAEAIAGPLLEDAPGPRITLVVEAGASAVDDGGVPLLGAYEPPIGSVTDPSTPPTITLWYRTFESCHADDETFEWEDELEETIEHELEHHLYFLRGDDPMDDAEHEAIEAEARAVVGTRETERRALAEFGSSFPDFFRRAWPLLLIALIALAITLAAQR